MTTLAWAPAGRAESAPSASAGAAAPSQPTGVVVTATDKRELTATWSAPAELNGAEITGYTVTFKQLYAATPKIVTVAVDVSAPRQATGTGLATWGNEVTVVAHSTGGDSPASASVQGSAYDDLFWSQGSSHFGVITLEPNDVWVSWGGFDANGAQVDRYEVWASYDTSAPIATFGQVAGARISNLPVGQRFTLTLVGVASSGLRASMPPREVLFVAPPSAPRQVSAVAGQESATISWLPSESTGGVAVEDMVYEVTVWPEDRTMVVPGTVTQATMDELQPGVEHTFSVKAYSYAGWSLPSEMSNAVTPTAAPVVPNPNPTPTPPPVPTPTPTADPTQPPAAQVPAPPSKPKVKVRGSKAVVTWTAPTSSVKATRYIVTVVRPNGKKSVTTVRKPLAVLKKLTPGRYRVSVMAGNDAGWSRASQRVSFKVGS